MDGAGYTATPLLDANTLTASTSDQNVTTTQLFVHVSVTNDDSTNSVYIAIGQDSTVSTNSLIEVKAGESFDESIIGEELHYSCRSGTPSFRYTLR